MESCVSSRWQAVETAEGIRAPDGQSSSLLGERCQLKNSKKINLDSPSSDEELLEDKASIKDVLPLHCGDVNWTLRKTFMVASVASVLACVIMLQRGTTVERASTRSIVQKTLLGRYAPFACGLSCSIISNASSSSYVVQTSLESVDQLGQSKFDITLCNGGHEMVADFHFDGPSVDINLGSIGHEIVGFGGAFTEAAAISFMTLPKELQQKIVDVYWGPHGIGYTLGRVHINSCDFSKESYAFHDQDGDFELNHFDHNVTHDQSALIPLIRQAQQALGSHGSSLKLLASPWSPPAWMKKNGAMTCAHSKHDSNCTLRQDCHAAWAKYISLWIDAYKRQGIPIWAITPQNEPNYRAPWEALIWDPSAYSDWLGGFLGPEMRSTHPEVKIFVYDSNKEWAYQWAQAVYNHPVAHQFADGVAVHWYRGDYFDALKKIQVAFPRAQLLATEACYELHVFGMPNASSGNFAFGEGYAHDVIGDLNSGSTGWIDWNLMLDMSGGPNHLGNQCDSPVFCSEEDQGHVYFHPQLYYMSHFSTYILPGSLHIGTNVSGSQSYSGPRRQYGTCSEADGLQATAARRPDGHIAAVVLNCAGSASFFKLRVRYPDGRAKCAIKTYIPGHAIQTYILKNY